MHDNKYDLNFEFPLLFVLRIHNCWHLIAHFPNTFELLKRGETFPDVFCRNIYKAMHYSINADSISYLGEITAVLRLYLTVNGEYSKVGYLESGNVMEICTTLKSLLQIFWTFL